jgi:preprotein translocase subunit SecG
MFANMVANSMLDVAQSSLLFASFAHYFFGITLSLLAIFLILLVLVQRGRGGGLAGAFGGMGGQSAFGTKAGDTFTKVTIGVSIAWILLCIASVKMLGHSAGSFGRASAPGQPQVTPGPASGDLPLVPGTDGLEPAGAPTGDSPADSAPASSAPSSATSAPDAAPQGE